MAHVKTVDGGEMNVASMGRANLNTVLGALGTAGFAGISLKDILGGGILGGSNQAAMLLAALAGMRGGGSIPAEDEAVTRYEMAQEQKLAAANNEIALLKSEKYTDQKVVDLYNALMAQINGLKESAAAQAVQNQGFRDAIREVSKDIDYKVGLEAERRSCADQRIVGYLNGNFATKAVAAYTAGTTATPVATYNPLCDCDCQ